MPAGSRDGQQARPKVLYAITTPSTALTILRGQLGYLRQSGFEVHLACESSPELRGFAENEGVILHDVPLSRSWLTFADIRGIARAVRVLRHVKPQVLSYSTPKAALVWAVASWCFRPSLVVYLLGGLRLEGVQRRSLGSVVLWTTEAISCRSAHVVVCVGPELRQRALELRLMGQEHAVVLGMGSTNGVDGERFRVAPRMREEMRRHLAFEESDFVVGYVGRLREDKGILDLLDALSLLEPDVRGLLIGPAEQDFDLQGLLARRNLTGRVQHVEFTLEVEHYYAAMDLFALPSHREGLPNVLLEAQAMNLPCITTDATGCRDAVREGITALVVPSRSPHQLARAIDQLARDPDQRAELGAAGRRWVREHFQPAAQWRRYSQLYERAAESEPRSEIEPQTRGVV